MSLFKKKKLSRNYHKLIKNNNKKLVKLAKEARPWDWAWGIDLLVAHLEYMKEYYSNGENVVAMENYEWNSKAIKKSRLEMIEEILSAYYNWVNCEDKYYKIIEHPETYKEYEENSYTVIEDLGCHIEYLLPNAEDNRKAFIKEYNENRKLFFNLLNKYIEELWD